MSIASFDLDGVILMGKYPGVYPGPNDIIITGRSKEEEKETLEALQKRGIKQTPFFNPIPFLDKTRERSGAHKAITLNTLKAHGYPIMCHYEDDPIQADIIKELVPDIEVILLQHNLTEKENVRHVGED